MTTLTAMSGELTLVRQHPLHQFVSNTTLVMSPELGQSMSKASELNRTSPGHTMGLEPPHLATTKQPA
jgi:hypothetical protein